MELAFVTGNPGKFKEAEGLLGDHVTLVQDTGGYDEIQADTLEAVARHGLAEVGRRRDPPYFLEDAGLFVDALKGFPGVYSAYAYKTLGWEGICRLLLGTDEDARTGRFQAVVGYRDPDGVDHVFIGTCEGTLTLEGRGDHGFGFDPIFVPAGHPTTFAEMDPAAKGKVSHRGKALRAFHAHLKAHPPRAPPPGDPLGGLPDIRADDPDEDPPDAPAKARTATTPPREEPTPRSDPTPKRKPRSRKKK